MTATAVRRAPSPGGTERHAADPTPGPRGQFALIGETTTQDVVDQAALRLVLQPRPVLLDHPVHGQRGRRPLEHHLGAVLVAVRLGTTSRPHCWARGPTPVTAHGSA